MKVVMTSNCDLENRRGEEYVVAGPGLSAADAEVACRRFREDPWRPAEDWFEVREDEHPLRRFKS